MNFPHTVYTSPKPDQDTKTCLFHWPPLCPELTTQIFCHFHLSLASSEPSLRAIEGRWLGTTDRRGEPGPRGSKVGRAEEKKEQRNETL